MFLTSNDSRCVTLSWSAPTYSNGVINRYQYTCNSKTDYTNSTTLQIQICNYKPYTKVECYVRALNNATEPGDIGKPAMNIYTKCDKPSFKRTPELNDTHYTSSDNRTRRQIHVSADVEANCNQTGLSVQYRIVNPNNTTFQDKSLFSNLSALTNYTFEVIARNWYYRNSRYISVMSGQLRKLYSY